MNGQKRIEKRRKKITESESRNLISNPNLLRVERMHAK